MTQHHCFIVPGVSEEAMKAVAYKRTEEDPDLEYFIHFHSYQMGVVYGRAERVADVCRDMCQVIRNGKLEKASTVTQTDDAIVQIPG